jgi:hypothetical protein
LTFAIGENGFSFERINFSPIAPFQWILREFASTPKKRLCICIKPLGAVGMIIGLIYSANTRPMRGYA